MSGGLIKRALDKISQLGGLFDPEVQIYAPSQVILLWGPRQRRHKRIQYMRVVCNDITKQPSRQHKYIRTAN